MDFIKTKKRKKEREKEKEKDRKKRKKKEKTHLRTVLLFIFDLAPLSTLYFTILVLRRENFVSGRPIVTPRISV